MFTAKFIFVCFVGMFFSIGLLALCEKIKFKHGEKLAVVMGFICAAYCFAAGIDLIPGWGDRIGSMPIGDISIAAAKHRRGGLFIFALTLWPYILIGLGGYVGYSNAIIYLRRFENK